MFRTDDPVADYERYSSRQEEELARRPICSICDEPIQDDYCYEVNGEYICPACMEENRKWVENCVC